MSFCFIFTSRIWIAVGGGPILSLRSSASCSRSWDIDGRFQTKKFALWADALERLSFKFNGHQPQNWKLSPERPLPLAVSCRLTWLTSRREFTGLSVWQPSHKGEHTNGRNGFLSLGGLFWGASGARPPSLSGFLWGFSLFSALNVPRDDHIFKDSQQSVVCHERAPS